MGKPRATDPRVVANEQARQSIGASAATELMKPDLFTPQGSRVREQTGTTTFDGKEVPTFRVRTSYSPGEQEVYDQGLQARQQLARLGASSARRLSETLGPLDVSGLPAAGRASDIAGPDNIQRVESALLARREPQLERERRTLEARLAGQGIRLGSDAYDTAMDAHARRVDDARSRVALEARGEQERLQRLGLAKFNVNNAARARALQEMTGLRSQPVNEIAALLHGGQVSQPSFQSTAVQGVAPPNVQAAYARYDQQRARSNPWGALLGLGRDALLLNWLKE